MSQPRTAIRQNITSLQSHILQEEARHPGSTGDFTWILSALSLAAKAIAHKVRRARIEDVLGDQGGANVHGETQQKLDVIANDILMTCLGNRPSVAVVASEEDEEPTILRRGDRGRQVLRDLRSARRVVESRRLRRRRDDLLDPAKRPDRSRARSRRSASRASQQVAAGYILYGSSTVFVLTTGNGVDMFVLDPSIGSFVLVQSKIRIPPTGKTYSVNEANRRVVSRRRSAATSTGRTQNGYSSRYIGSMVADIHRTLLKGGVFLYPPTKKNPEGKLRLMYEANPIAMIVEQAGGKAVAVDRRRRPARILDIQPTSIHQRTSVVIGSRDEVDAVLRHQRRQPRT